MVDFNKEKNKKALFIKKIKNINPDNLLSGIPPSGVRGIDYESNRTYRKS